MAKKKCKKKHKRETSRSPSSSQEADDKSSLEKEYRKRREISEEEGRRTFYIKSIQDEDRATQAAPLPSPKKPNSESSTKKDRQYKKPVYRLGTVTSSEREKDHKKEAKEKHSKNDSASILETASKRPHSTTKTSSSSDEFSRKNLSEEFREQRRRLMKRRSRESLESESNSHLHRCQGKGTEKHSPEPKKQPIAFEKVQPSISISTAISKGLPGHSESSKPSGSDLDKKALLEPHKPLSFKILKKTNIIAIRSEAWDKSPFRDGKSRVSVKVPCKSIPGHSPRPENVDSVSTFSVRKTVAEKARQSCEISPKASHLARASTSSPQRQLEVPQSHPHTGGRKSESMAARFSETTQSPRVSSTVTGDNDQEMQLMAELHQARSQRLLEVNVDDSYGELTSMDIDPPEEIPTFSFRAEHIHQDLIIVLDTNILLSHLDFVKKMRSHGLGALGFPNILIPWVVMQELDALKDGKLSSDVKHKAKPAVHYIYTMLKTREPRLWGQSMQQAARRICGVNAENNDDRVLQCCLQYQGLYPEVALILCTNDKNLCSKALLSGVKAMSKADLESEVGRVQSDTQTHHQQAFPVCWPPQTGQRLSGIHTTQLAEDRDASGNKIDVVSEDERRKAAEKACKVSASMSVLEEALQGALSQILEAEMKAAFDNLWFEVVFVKPPWTLSDILVCFKKHWIAVFGSIVQRSLLNSVEYLSDSLCKGKTLDWHSTQQAAKEAHELLLAFSCRSDYGGSLPKSLSVLESLLQDPPQSDGRTRESPGNRAPASSDGDVLMAVEEGTTNVQSSYQDVWAVFENIWSNVCQISSAVFTALRFVPSTLETSMPSDGPPPSEEALSCLQKLTAAVKQLLESLQRVLSSKSSFEDVQALLAFINTSEIATMKPRFSAKDLFECLSQQEYREKLCVGGNQLVELSNSLDHCASAVGHQAGSSSWP